MCSVFSVEFIDKIKKGELGTSREQRLSAGLLEGQDADVQAYVCPEEADALTMTCSLQFRDRDAKHKLEEKNEKLNIDGAALNDCLKDKYSDQVGTRLFQHITD